MPNVGDELHHFGWNRCSSACHGPDRSHLIVPGFRSSRIHIVNVADDPRRPRIEKVIEPRRDRPRSPGYTRPHTVALHARRQRRHLACSATPTATAPAASRSSTRRTFEVKGRWENGGPRPPFNYDFWYQPRKNTLVSSEFGAPERLRARLRPRTTSPPGATASRLHFWNLAERRALEQTLDLGENGLVPLEIRWQHDPDADEGFVGATLSQHHQALPPRERLLRAEPVIEVDNGELEGWPLPAACPV